MNRTTIANAICDRQGVVEYTITRKQLLDIWQSVADH
jgi:hypothetical protein